MGAAFDMACEALKAGSHYDVVREVLAKRIIDAAVKGELDPKKLCARGLAGIGIRQDEELLHRGSGDQHMKTQSIRIPTDRSASLKLLVVRHQELAAQLHREGKAALAKAARAKLLTLLNQFELLSSLQSERPHVCH